MKGQRDREKTIQRTKSRNTICSFLVRQINKIHLFTGQRHNGTLFDRVRFEVRSEKRPHVV